MLVALTGLTGAAASEDMSVSLRLLAANATAGGNNTGSGTPSKAAPYKIDLAVETAFSADIGNMTAMAFVSQMASSTEWVTTTTTSMFDILKGTLKGLKKKEIKNVKAVHKARRLSSGRQLAAKAIKYDTKFSVVPDYSVGTPSYMTALNTSTANSGMSMLDKLINEVTAAVAAAVSSGAFAGAALKAVQAAAASGALKNALAAAGAPADAISKLKTSDITVKAPVVSNGYTGTVQTTKAGFVAGAAKPATTAATTASNAAAAGVAGVVASMLMMF